MQGSAVVNSYFQAIAERRDAPRASHGSSSWSTGTILAVSFSSTVFIILPLAFYFLVRRNKSFSLRRRTFSVSKVIWSPITPLEITPLPTPGATPRSTYLEKRYTIHEDADSPFSATKLYIDEASPCQKKVSQLQTLSEEETPSGRYSRRSLDTLCISPLPLSPLLVQLPSVKSLPSSRVHDLVRPGLMTGGIHRETTSLDEQRLSVTDSEVPGLSQMSTPVSGRSSIYQSVEERSPPSLAELRRLTLNLAERRSALIVPDDFRQLLENNSSGPKHHSRGSLRYSFFFSQSSLSEVP
ncbi:hypothetical protein BKA70DRAFT_1522356 [Coprinopsis sp. MPI-PUGE-AT-0042]|nr:hypothetical protein BKA70DRAFT_1522356 [Coprinopsis sp. MPI-PUGE-AT-0042]